MTNENLYICAQNDVDDDSFLSLIKVLLESGSSIEDRITFEYRKQRRGFEFYYAFIEVSDYMVAISRDTDVEV